VDRTVPGREMTGAAQFSKVLHRSRATRAAVAKLRSRLLGLEAKMRSYAEGEVFVEVVFEGRGGPSC